MSFAKLKVSTVLASTIALFAFGAANPAQASSILIAPSQVVNPGFNAALAAAFPGDIVTYYDARLGTPTVAELSAYDAVFTWADFPYNNNVLFGDNLAAYVDGGGRVILGAFTTYTSGNYLSGQIMTSAYSPVVSPGGNNLFTSSSYAGDGTPLLWSGVTSYTAVYRDDVVLQGAGILDGTFADGEIAGAYRPDLGVIYLGGLETLTENGGDYIQLLSNAVHAGRADEVPEPASLLLFGSGIAAVTAFRRRSRG